MHVLCLGDRIKLDSTVLRNGRGIPGLHGTGSLTESLPDILFLLLPFLETGPTISGR